MWEESFFDSYKEIFDATYDAQYSLGHLKASISVMLKIS